MTSEPPHRGPSILSEYGEGYCRWCQFIVGLSGDGLIMAHSRNTMISPRECKGSRTRPPKLTPYTSRKAAFKLRSQLAWCPQCRQWAPTSRYDRGWYYARHQWSATICPGTGRQVVEQQDQNNARG